MTDAASETATGLDRRIDRRLARYEEHHRNVVNRAIHMLAVPAIYWSVLALLVELPFPDALGFVPGLDWGLVAGVAMVVAYLLHSRPLAIGMAVMTGLFLVVAWGYARFATTPLWQMAIAVFVIAWIFQFIGHKIEGQRPAFFDDLRFLAIGPGWVLARIYRLLGIRY
ncbi:MAG: Mpo1-like protein [Pseudomonadota bacterium]